MMVHAHNASTWEAETAAGIATSSRAAGSIEQVPGQLWIHRMTLQKQKQPQNKTKNQVP